MWQNNKESVNLAGKPPQGVETVDRDDRSTNVLVGHYWDFVEQRVLQTSDDKQAFCKATAGKYFVKNGSCEYNLGRLLDPWSNNYVRGQESGTKHTIPYYTWKAVPKDSYDLYLKFLDTKNLNYLKAAERGSL